MHWIFSLFLIVFFLACVVGIKKLLNVVASKNGDRNKTFKRNFKSSLSLDDEAYARKSEIVWKFIFGEYRSERADKFLAKQRDMFLPLAKEKTSEEKEQLLSGIEFDRVKGQTFLRKQTREERLMTIQLLEFERIEPGAVLDNLRKAFDPRDPAFFVLRGQVEFPEKDWQLKSWASIVKRGCALTGNAPDCKSP